MKVAVVRAVVIAATVGLLCGCTGTANAPVPDTASPTASATADDLRVGEIQQPPELKEGWQGILRDVTVTSCPTAAGEVTATGTVVNSADDTRDISIVVSWNAPGSTRSLMQLAVTKRGVPAGKTVNWKASSELPSASGPCVVLARSGTIVKG